MAIQITTPPPFNLTNANISPKAAIEERKINFNSIVGMLDQAIYRGPTSGFVRGQLPCFYDDFWALTNWYFGPNNSYADYNLYGGQGCGGFGGTGGAQIPLGTFQTSGITGPSGLGWIVLSAGTQGGGYVGTGNCTNNWDAAPILNIPQGELPEVNGYWTVDALVFLPAYDGSTPFTGMGFLEIGAPIDGSVNYTTHGPVSGSTSAGIYFGSGALDAGAMGIYAYSNANGTITGTKIADYPVITPNGDWHRLTETFYMEGVGTDTGDYLSCTYSEDLGNTVKHNVLLENIAMGQNQGSPSPLQIPALTVAFGMLNNGATVFNNGGPAIDWLTITPSAKAPT